MFVVLNIERYSKKVSKRKSKKINRSPPVICHTERGLPFYLLNVCEEKRGIDWKKTSERCGRYVSRIVAPRNILMPDDGCLRRFIPSTFVSLLVFNSAVQLLKSAEIDPKIFTITLSDRNAFLAGEVCRLLPFSSQVRIITSHPERYAFACTKALEEYGATLIIRSAYELSSKPDFVISCDGAYNPLMESQAVISAKRSCGGVLRFIGKSTELTDSHKKIISPSVEPTDFAGALTELCACSEYSGAVFSDIDISCKKCEAENKNCLKCYIEGRFESSHKPINS